MPHKRTKTTKKQRVKASRAIRAEREKGTPPEKAIAIGLSKAGISHAQLLKKEAARRKRKKKGGSAHGSRHKHVPGM